MSSLFESLASTENIWGSIDFCASRPFVMRLILQLPRYILGVLSTWLATLGVTGNEAIDGNHQDRGSCRRSRESLGFGGPGCDPRHRYATAPRLLVLFVR